MSSIKYQYGLDSNGQTINIKDLHPSKEVRKEIFRCLGCDNILVPILGEKRKKHFRHKSDVEVNCSGETYLHKLAKNRFYEVYSNCLNQNKPFDISFEINKICNHYQQDFLKNCSWEQEQKKIDLTKSFKTIKLEEKYDDFIPDLLLFSDQEQVIFVEIAVTHAVTQEKIHSRQQIIEINIHDENAIKLIDEECLWESEKVKFINFEQVQDFCKGKCIEGIEPGASSPITYCFFVIYSSGRSQIFPGDLIGFDKTLKKYPIEYYEILLISGDKNDELFLTRLNEIFIEKVVEAHFKKLYIKDCYLCHYHGTNFYNDRSTSIFCKFLEKSCHSKQAANCQYYTVDPKAFPITEKSQSLITSSIALSEVPSITPPTTSSETPSITPPTTSSVSVMPKFKDIKRLIHPDFGEGLIIEIIHAEAARVEFSGIGIEYIYLPNCQPILEN